MLGFYFRTRQEFSDFITTTKQENSNKISKGIQPLFTIENSPPAAFHFTGSVIIINVIFVINYYNLRCLYDVL